jgi:regulator of sigma E protease
MMTFLNGIWNLILFLIILGIIVLVHEFGHFLFAKLSNTYVYEFAIGMGKKIFSFHRKNDETEYSIRLIPIGGFNQIAGENGELEEDDIPKNRKMCSKSFLQRFLILFAGPGFNFILTFVVLFLSALIFGSTTTKAVIGSVGEEYPAYEAGIQVGDTILSINDQKVNSWDSAILIIQTNNGKTLNFEVKDSSGNIKKIEISPQIVTDKDGNSSYVYGIGKDGTLSHGLVNSFSYAWHKTGSLFNVMFYTVKSLFTGGVSVNDLSGPVGIYTIVGEQAKAGIDSLLYLLAYLSINVGVINLIPFPAFDGGRIVLLLIEKIIRKPINPKVENAINGIGFMFLMLLMLYVTGHDIFNLFN